jgi:hypothetical protein
MLEAARFAIPVLNTQRFTELNMHQGCFRLALFAIQQTDLTSFLEDERGVKWPCN